MTPAVILRLSVYCNSILSLTQPIVPLILIMFPPATAEVFEDHSYVAENDERRRKDRPFMEGHDQLVPLELPHLVGDGLHFKECVTVRIKANISSIQHCFTHLSLKRCSHGPPTVRSLMHSTNKSEKN